MKILIADEESLVNSSLRKYFNGVYLLSDFKEKFEDPNNLNRILPKYHFMVIGEKSFKYLRDSIHFGLRKTQSYNQLIDLEFLSMPNGARLLFNRNMSNTNIFKDKLQKFFSDNFGSPRIPVEPSLIKYITDSSVAISTLTKASSYTGEYGMDYETSGFPEEESFQVVGVSLATVSHAIYIDFRSILLEGEDTYNEFLLAFKKFLDIKHEDVWVYNYSFEMKVSYKLYKKFYYFNDASVYRIIQGKQSQVWSLKYMAQYNLSVPSWDDHYDQLMGNIKESLETRSDLVSKLNELGYDSDQIDEFSYWYNLGYKSEFTVIPTELIGKYCCLDSYYTLHLRDSLKDKYSKDCVDVYLANNRLGARLTGVFRDEELFLDYKKVSIRSCIYGNFHSARIYLANYFRTLKSYKEDSLSDLDKFLLNTPLDFRNDAYLSKSILERYYDSDFDFCIDEERLMDSMGDSANLVIDYVKENFPEEWDLAEYRRKRSIHLKLGALIQEKFNPKIKANFEKVKHYFDTKRLLEGLDSEPIADMTLDEIKSLDSIEFKGKVWENEELILDELKEYFPIASPVEYDEASTFMGKQFKDELCLLSYHYKEREKRKSEESFGREYEMPIPWEFKGGYKNYLDKVDPEFKKWRLRGIKYNYRKVEEAWEFSNIFEFISKDICSSYNLGGLDSTQVLNDNTMTYEFQDLLRFEMCRHLWKKYNKLRTTYFNSIYGKGSRQMTLPDKNLVSDYEGDPSKESTVLRLYPYFNINEKFTKRWSSGLSSAHFKVF